MIVVEEVKLKKRLIGVVVAVGSGRVSYSICHPIDEKQSSLGRAVEIAVGRVHKRKDSVARLATLRGRFERMAERPNRDDALLRFGLIFEKLILLRMLSKRLEWSEL